MGARTQANLFYSSLTELNQTETKKDTKTGGLKEEAKSHICGSGKSTCNR